VIGDKGLATPDLENNPINPHELHLKRLACNLSTSLYQYFLL
jgi:hypothetical protein